MPWSCASHLVIQSAINNQEATGRSRLWWKLWQRLTKTCIKLLQHKCSSSVAWASTQLRYIQLTLSLESNPLCSLCMVITMAHFCMVYWYIYAIHSIEMTVEKLYSLFIVAAWDCSSLANMEGFRGTRRNIRNLMLGIKSIIILYIYSELYDREGFTTSWQLPLNDSMQLSCLLLQNKCHFRMNACLCHREWDFNASITALNGSTTPDWA